ncbi:MAG: hypothetical protein WA874_04345 [Chryseosolibacter sp.]
MKHTKLTSALFLTLALLGCQDTKDVPSPLSEKDHYKLIGEEIPFETAMAWLDFHKKSNAAQGRTEEAANFSVSAEKMQALLSSTEDLTGVAFHYGIDSLGDKHIFLIPVDGSLSVWSTTQDRVIIDANTGNEIDPSLASAWADNYKNAHPEELWFHFFGKNIFDDMLALPGFKNMDIAPATHDVELTPELLLIIWEDETIASGGRTELLYAIVFDASNACPPCAVL